MGSLGPAQLMCLLLVVAAVAGTAGFVASARLRRRRARRIFLVGFAGGLLAGAVLRGRRRALSTLATAARLPDPRRVALRRDAARFASRAGGFASSRVALALRPRP